VPPLPRLRLTLILLAWASLSVLFAARLPIRTYTDADRLARNHVLCIVQDSRGFDGYQFTNYRTEHGLPSNSVTAFLESYDGNYWVAVNRGVCRFDATARLQSRARFQSVSLFTPGPRTVMWRNRQESHRSKRIPTFSRADLHRASFSPAMYE
jgi:hypothetical protein